MGQNFQASRLGQISMHIHFIRSTAFFLEFWNAGISRIICWICFIFHTSFRKFSVLSHIDLIIQQTQVRQKI